MLIQVTPTGSIPKSGQARNDAGLSDKTIPPISASLFQTSLGLCTYPISHRFFPANEPDVLLWLAHVTGRGKYRFSYFYTSLWDRRYPAWLSKRENPELGQNLVINVQLKGSMPSSCKELGKIKALAGILGLEIHRLLSPHRTRGYDMHRCYIT